MKNFRKLQSTAIMEINRTLTLESLIKELILADLQHSQLIFGLEALQLAPMDYHFLNLYQLIANWMGFRSDEELDTFMDIYQSFMYKSTSYPVSQHGLDLKPLVDECFLALRTKATTLEFPDIPNQTNYPTYQNPKAGLT